MPDTQTPFKGLTKQTIGGNVNTWGTILNANEDIADKALGGTLNKTIAGNYTVTTSEAQNSAFKFAGTLGGAATIVFPTYYGTLVVQNLRADALTCGMGGKSVIVLPLSTVAIYSDGVDFVQLSAAASGLHWGRMKNMTVIPGSGLAYVVSGDYWAGQKFTVAGATLTLPGTSGPYYIVGSAAGAVSITASAPGSAWPPSDTAPVLLATIALPAAPVARVQCLPFPNGIITTFTCDISSLAAWGAASSATPGTIRLYQNDTLLAHDDGAGHMASDAATVTSSSVNYAAGTLTVTLSAAPIDDPTHGALYCAIGWTVGQAHESWKTEYPPVDGLVAQTTRAALDSGERAIPGWNAPVGLPPSVPAASLANPRLNPFGLDGYDAPSHSMRLRTSGREYADVALIGDTFYFEAADELVSGEITVAIVGGAIDHFTGLPHGSAGPIDPETVAFTVTGDGTGFDGYPAYDTNRRYAQIIKAAGGTGWSSATASIVGGGVKNTKFLRFFIDVMSLSDAFQANDSGATDRRSVASSLYLSDGTIVCSLPNQGGGTAVAFPGGLTADNLLIDGFGVGIYHPYNSTCKNGCIRNCGLGGGSHGAALNVFGGIGGQSKYATSVGGQLYVGWSHFETCCFSAPGPSSPRYNGTETSSLINQQNFSPAEPVGTTDIYYQGCVYDGGTFSIGHYPAHAAQHAPIRRMTHRDGLFTRDFEYSPLGWNLGGGDDVSGIDIINPRWIDSGQKIAAIEGRWSIVAGVPTKGALPGVDNEGIPIVVTGD